MESESIIIFLLGTIQVIIGVVIGYIFKVISTLFNKMDTNRKEFRDLIDKNSAQDKDDKKELEDKMVDLLNRHYVTNGQLDTLEQKLMSEIRQLTLSIEHLTEAIKSMNICGTIKEK